MSASTMERLRENLWEAYVYRFVSARPTTSEEKQAAALHVLQLHREIYAKAKVSEDKERKLKVLGSLNVVWQLLSHEAGSWVLDAIGDIVPDVSDRQVMLLALLKFQEPLGPETHRPALDPLSLLIPRALATELSDAIEALSKGETTPLLTPRYSARHGNAWTRDRMRLRALEHVAFLEGQGFATGIARARVSAAMRKVSPETLRDWRKRECRQTIPDLDECLQSATAAGRLATRLCDDPEFGSRAGESIDSGHMHLLNELLKSEPLPQFGRRYTEMFGGRHFSSPPSGGK
jgi:hypothetical protein